MVHGPRQNVCGRKVEGPEAIADSSSDSPQAEVDEEDEVYGEAHASATALRESLLVPTEAEENEDEDEAFTNANPPRRLPPRPPKLSPGGLLVGRRR